MFYLVLLLITKGLAGCPRGGGSVLMGTVADGRWNCSVKLNSEGRGGGGRGGYGRIEVRSCHILSVEEES